ESIVLVCAECCTVVGSLQPALDTFPIICALGLGGAVHGCFQHLTLKLPLVHDVSVVTGFRVPRNQAARIAQDQRPIDASRLQRICAPRLTKMSDREGLRELRRYAARRLTT